MKKNTLQDIIKCLIIATIIMTLFVQNAMAIPVDYDEASNDDVWRDEGAFDFELDGDDDDGSFDNKEERDRSKHSGSSRKRKYSDQTIAVDYGKKRNIQVLINANCFKRIYH